MNVVLIVKETVDMRITLINYSSQPGRHRQLILVQLSLSLALTFPTNCSVVTTSVFRIMFLFSLRVS